MSRGRSPLQILALAAAVASIAVAAGMLPPAPGTLLRAAEVKVTQGPAPEKVLFSPMFLEMPLEVGVVKPGTWVNVDDFDAWTCDFVHVRRIATRIVPHKDRVDLDLKVWTFTDASRDKAVRMEFRLFREERVLGETLIPHIEAEEKKSGYGVAAMTVPKDRWPDTGSLVMKIAVYVKND
jgi:hypothetical protein